MSLDQKEIADLLTKKFSYYNKLSDFQKTKFIDRLCVFLKRKKFSAREGIELTMEIRVLVSAPAIQLTLGMEDFLLDYFENILVYPDVYKNPHTGNFHKGETNLSGFICFSFKHLLKGFEKEHDNHNLGLHEFAHALRFSSIKGHEGDVFFENYFPKLIAVAEQEYFKLRRKQDSIFRNYGGSNINEFFSVIVEHFFESPLQFKLHHPEIFKHLCVLLNQIPSPHSVELDVRGKLLTVKNEKLFTNLLGATSSYGGIFPVVSLFGLIGFVFIMIYDAGKWQNYLSVFILSALMFLTFIFPKLKRVLIFKEGILLSWMMNGVFRREPLFIEYERMISVRMVGERKSNSNEVQYKTNVLQVLYYFDMQFKTLEIDCNFDSKITKELISIFKKQKIHLMLSGIYQGQ